MPGTCELCWLERVEDGAHVQAQFAGDDVAGEVHRVKNHARNEAEQQADADFLDHHAEQAEESSSVPAGTGAAAARAASAASAASATRIVTGKFAIEKNGSTSRNALTRRNTSSQL